MSEEPEAKGLVVVPIVFRGPGCREEAIRFVALANQNGLNAVLPNELTVVSLLFDSAPGPAETWALEQLMKSLDEEEGTPCEPSN